MHDAKRGGRVSVTMTLIFFKIVWMCPLTIVTIIRGHIQTILKKINVIMTLGSRATTLQVM